MLVARTLAGKSVLAKGEAGGLRAPGGHRVLWPLSPREGSLSPLPSCRVPSPQDALQQRLLQQDAAVLQLKQELLRATMDKEELHNQNVSHCCCCCCC